MSVVSQTVRFRLADCGRKKGNTLYGRRRNSQGPACYNMKLQKTFVRRTWRMVIVWLKWWCSIVDVLYTAASGVCSFFIHELVRPRWSRSWQREAKNIANACKTNTSDQKWTNSNAAFSLFFYRSYNRRQNCWHIHLFNPYFVTVVPFCPPALSRMGIAFR